jgi:hypothetical protein
LTAQRVKIGNRRPPKKIGGRPVSVALDRPISFESGGFLDDIAPLKAKAESSDNFSTNNNNNMNSISEE